MDCEARSVAVIGMACRFPGAASPDELWDVLQSGRDVTSETPAERYDIDRMYSPSPAPGSVTSRRAGYLDSVADFDAGFFGMSATEAAELDPQQRLLLMTAWEALEDAGQVPSRLAGGRTAVYIGNTRGDFLEQRFRDAEHKASQLGNFRAMLAARLSYQLDLRGESFVLDTACSSSLAAVHQAVQSVRAGTAPLAIAGGVNLVLRPDESLMMTQAGTLAADGRSKFGDASADGFAPSDGVGVIVLKPLADARADGDRIRAVIRGSAASNNGRTSDQLLVASVQGSTDVLRWAYEDAGVDPADVDYVEAHGSGQPMLDRVELTSLGKVVGEGRPADRPCWVGSVKTNLGYAEAAGSIAGLIKTVLLLEHRRIPPNLHMHTPSPDIDWDELPLAMPSQLLELTDRGRPLVAGVTGQGASCLNAHVVLREGELPRTDGPDASGDGEAYLLPLSARSPEALRALTTAYIDYLAPGGKGAAYAVRDICHSAATRREHHACRTAVAGASHEELMSALHAAAAPDPDRLPVLAAAAAQYRSGRTPDWDALFGRAGKAACFVPLPVYAWQTRRYWPGEAPDEGGDLATSLLREHARTTSVYRDADLLSEIGIDSLARIEIIAKLAQEHRFDVDPQELALLQTVGHFRAFCEQLEAETV